MVWVGGKGEKARKEGGRHGERRDVPQGKHAEIRQVRGRASWQRVDDGRRAHATPIGPFPSRLSAFPRKIDAKPHVILAPRSGGIR